ncbi:MAG TPA: type II toxin-antitoxin system Phd/YefM family antitoxin [Thermoanaerobaculia bacterium]|nr:type II toxin-antitoxin system Phd/YefM family antitoxin [Thermoanaerobaculia bacterium]
MKKKSIAEARNNLPQLVKDAEAGQPVELTRHGRRVAVIVSAREYDRLAAKKTNFWDAYQTWLKNHDVVALDLDPDEFLAGIRDRDPGPEPDL